MKIYAGDVVEKIFKNGEVSFVQQDEKFFISGYINMNDLVKNLNDLMIDFHYIVDTNKAKPVKVNPLKLHELNQEDLMRYLTSKK